jgi:ABC-type glutathione transport system ATPase component
VQPSLVIADEITSALDASVQKEVLALIADLQSRLGFTMLFISHNLAVVQAVSDEVLVLFRGDLVEQGSTSEIFSRARHDYTKRLLAAVPGLPGFTLE